MWPQINLNVGPLTLQHLYLLFVPLIPGGLLVGGFLMAHPRLTAVEAGALGLGHYSWIAALVFVSYVVGFTLYFLSLAFCGVLSAVLLTIAFRKGGLVRNNLGLSQRPVWRRVAARFLGQGLAPQAPPPPNLLAPNLAAVQPLHDAEWQELYNVLQDYVLRAGVILSNDAVTVWTAFQATGWAMVLMAFVAPAWRHPALLSAAVIAVIYGAASPFSTMFMYATFDRLTYWEFVARLLADVHAREAQGVTSGKPSA